ncbi:MAG: aspartate aminotransferase family protein [Bacteroidetes bacterium]|nr:aspartate aminotransferase family protein [Bacteroidota bacterium]
MKLFDVYPLYNITPVKASSSRVWDDNGTEYLDLYGGHAVISIGHSHPHYQKLLRQQIDKLGFYSNSIVNPLQEELAEKLGELSGYEDYDLFLCNSGAEAIENALKLASFQTDRKGIIAFEKAFHGRTSAAVAATDNAKIQAPVNRDHVVEKIGWNDLESLEKHLKTENFAAVIIEGVQGIGGIFVPEPEFLKKASELCKKYGTVFILDEIQSGYGRTGKFFAHQYADIKPDLITVAKGMGNGFPIGGVLISPDFKPWHGMLGTTFGGNHLACVAGIAVLDVIKAENLIEKAAKAGDYLIKQLAEIEGIKEVRGMGLMLGIELTGSAKSVREKLLFGHHIFTGSASDPNVLRLLPPMCIEPKEIDHFLDALRQTLHSHETVSQNS